jgi:hypothetical protein
MVPRGWAGRMSAFLFLAAVALVLWRAAGTLELGNGLHRVGAFEAAASVYRAELEDDHPEQLVQYNLGTALLMADSDEAERYLTLAAQGPDRALAQKAHYNVGYRLLRATDDSADQVATVALLLAAIRSNRTALRLDPDDADARWNLAVAQRRYEALPNISEEGPAERSEGEVSSPPEDDVGMGGSTGVGAGADDEGSPPDDALSSEGGGAGASEAPLGTEDPGPLSEGEARRLLEEIVDDPARAVQGILWSERPDAN